MSERTRRCGSRRRGITLVEVISVLAVLLLIGVATVKILGSMTEIGARLRSDTLGRASIERLAVTFRHDVHQSRGVTVGEAGWPLEISLAEDQVRYDYDRDARSIRRSVFRSGNRVAGDEFVLPRQCQPEAEADARLVAIEFTLAGESSPWIVEALRE